MKDTDPDFDSHVAILTEAARISPRFGGRVDACRTDTEIDAMVEEGRRLIQEDSEQAGM